MTSTKKKVTRISETPCSPKHKKIVIDVGPGDFITMREAGTRTRHSIGFGSVYWLAAKQEAQNRCS